MSDPGVQQLFPMAKGLLPLNGLYLRHDLQTLAGPFNRPFVFSNFIVSLDGRIATPKPGESERTEVPPSLANGRDWRLFQELAAQSDIYLVSGRYMSNLYQGLTTKMMNLEDPGYEDLGQWRRERGMTREPDIAVMSRSLAFHIPRFLLDLGVTVHIFTPKSAAMSARRRLAGQGGIIHPIEAGVASVLTVLGALGYRVILSPAGPNILHQLVAHQALDRLYLTHGTQLIGRHGTLPLADGAIFDPAFKLRLRELYLDPAGANGADQFMAVYEPTLTDAS